MLAVFGTTAGYSVGEIGAHHGRKGRRNSFGVIAIIVTTVGAPSICSLQIIGMKDGESELECSPASVHGLDTTWVLS